MNNENRILKIIKYAPPILTIILFFIIFLFLYINSQATFDESKSFLRKQYIENNKQHIKNQVTRVYKHIINEQKQTEERLKKSLKEQVNQAHTIAMNIYNENKHLDKKIVTKMIKDALRNIRFNNNRGYFFIYSFDYECILLPIAKHLEGTDFYNFQDSKKTYLTRNIIKMLKEKDEVYLKWWYYKPSNMKEQFEKIGFNKVFKPYNWFIGTGEYIVDFENDIKKNVLKYINNLEYENNGYIFTLDYNGNYLTHIKKDIIGQNALDVKDIKKHQTILDTIELAKQGKGFVTYIQNKKPLSNSPVKKTSYIIGIQNWQWFIGKGFYEDYIEKVVTKQKDIINARFEKHLQQLTFFAIIFIILLLLFSLYISKVLQKEFKNYQLKIKSNLKEITKQHDILAQQSKMAAIGMMIANIAHQWRQPLSLISTAATGIKLKKEIDCLSDKEFNENLDFINNSTQYLSKTIDDFRNFFATDKENKIFTIKEAFDNTFKLISSQFKNKDIEIINNINESKLFYIKSELIQVLINIINNSIDELAKLENQKRLIILNSYERNKELIISIKDNGGGIKPEIIEHVFEPYFTTKHKSQGTGIGMYMSEEIIVKHMNGKINIQNCTFEYDDIKYNGAEVILELKLV